MYTLITRPDVATAVSICARYVQSPRETHLDAAKRILRFLYHTRETPLVYFICNDILVKAFVAGFILGKRHRHAQKQVWLWNLRWQVSGRLVQQTSSSVSYVECRSRVHRSNGSN